MPELKKNHQQLGSFWSLETSLPWEVSATSFLVLCILVYVHLCFGICVAAPDINRCVCLCPARFDFVHRQCIPCVRSDRFSPAMVHLPDMPHCSCNLWLNPLCHSTVSFLISICSSFQSFLNNGDAVIAFEMCHKRFLFFFFSSPLCQAVQLEDTVRGIDNLFQLFSWNKCQWLFCMFPCLLSTLISYYSWQK